MDADPADSLVALDAPHSHLPPALPCHVTQARQQQVCDSFNSRKNYTILTEEEVRTLFILIELTG